MTNAKRARYTLEYKQEAVRLVESAQSIAAAARSLGMVDQTLCNWVKASREGSELPLRANFRPLRPTQLGNETGVAPLPSVKIRACVMTLVTGPAIVAALSREAASILG